MLLGYRVSTDGLCILEDCVATRKVLATSKTLKELWHIWCLFGSNRQFTAQYVIIVAPLTRLTKGTRFLNLPDGSWRPRATRSSNMSLDGWRAEHDEALETLKELLSSPPTLAFPDFTLPLILCMDVSHDGMTACLHQWIIPASSVPVTATTGAEFVIAATEYPTVSFDFPK